MKQKKKKRKLCQTLVLLNTNKIKPSDKKKTVGRFGELINIMILLTTIPEGTKKYNYFSVKTNLRLTNLRRKFPKTLGVLYEP